MSTRDPRDAGLRTDPGLGEDLDATVRARREPGDDYGSAPVDSFLEKVERRIGEAVDRRVRRQPATARDTRRPKPAGTWAERYGSALVTLVLAIPLSAIAGAFAGRAGTVVTRTGIVGVDAVQAARLDPELFAGRGRAARDDPELFAGRGRAARDDRPAPGRHACRVGSTTIWRRLTCRGRLAA
ncbi:hypothetical protein [Streptomyces sp. PBH53]|uniref:hypothetical protein n=1 Tax=Streptomyces sp. PBH53 TaxID=1577075 RepID=UPI002678A308|nr:hypothetical protein [Streptomyces sp. PBH53]